MYVPDTFSVVSFFVVSFVVDVELLSLDDLLTAALLNAFRTALIIPLELNVPLVVGGAVNWFVTTRSKDASLNTERGEKGTLLASGFIAGGALMGVISAAMRFGGINLVNEAWLNNTWSEVLALGAYALLILYFIKASMKVK